MASGVPHRLLASVIDKARKEKEDRLRKEWEAHRAAVDEAEAVERQDALMAGNAKREKDEQSRIAKESDERTRGQMAVAASAQLTDEERVAALNRRLQDFRGNDDASMRERLLSEGFSEALTQEQLRLRTLDQRVGNELGMRASMRSTDPRVLSAIAPTSFDTAVSGADVRLGGEPDSVYLRSSNPDASYHSNELPDAVRGHPPSYEANKDRDKESGVRKALGLGPTSLYDA